MDLKLDKDYNVSEVAKEVGIANTTLYSWEKALGITVKRKPDQSRYYTDEDIQVYKKIKEYRDKRFSLESIKQALERNNKFLQMEEEALSCLPVEQLTGNELEEVVRDSVESGLKTVVEAFKESMKEQVRNEFKTQFEGLKIENETLKNQNEKILVQLEKLNATIDEEKNKNFLQRLFRK